MMKRRLVFLAACVAVLALAHTTAFAHVEAGSAAVLAITLDAPVGYVGIGSEVSVIPVRDGLSADEVIWRLYLDGRAFPFEGGGKDGISFVPDRYGTYVVRAIARVGDVYATRSVRIVAGAGSDEPVAPADRAGVDVSLDTGVNRRALYSWSSVYLREGYWPTVRQVMSMLDCDTIYQCVPLDAKASDVASFLSRCQRSGYRVYYLCGAPSWAKEEDAASMLAAVDRAAYLNECAMEGGIAGFYGIQYDVEALNRAPIMAQVTKNCEAVMARVSEMRSAGKLQYDLKIEACLSRSLDSTYGFDNAANGSLTDPVTGAALSYLEYLVKYGCDSVAIMNYGVDEVGHIAVERTLCAKYGKPIVNITEMQAVGDATPHNLKPEQTYGDDGVDAAERLWQSLDAVYPGMGYAYHYLNPMLGLLGIR